MIFWKSFYKKRLWSVLGVILFIQGCTSATDTGVIGASALTGGNSVSAPSSFYYPGGILSNSYNPSSSIPTQYPVVSGVTPYSYSVTPTLPTGLELDPVSGNITGIASVLAPLQFYTVTVANDYGTANTTLGIENSFSYSSTSFVFPISSPIPTESPYVPVGTVSSYSINPPTLPSGLTFTTSTGNISGTPTLVTAATNYTVTANLLAGGSVSTPISIQVTPDVPILSYSATTGTVGTPLSISPTISSVASVTNCAILPAPTATPSWLNLSSTCVVTGAPAPTNSLPTTTYYVVATSSLGNSLPAPLVLTVNPSVPTLSYASPTVPFTIGSPLSISPSALATNGGTLTSCSLTAATLSSFPGTLSINPSNCVISGTPTAALSPAPTFEVVAKNLAGSSSAAALSFSIIAGLPTATYSSSSYTLNVGTPVTLTPTLNAHGNPITSCTVSSGSLPAGLSLGTSSANRCVISGTPTTPAATTTATITPEYSSGPLLSGSPSALSFTVNASPPVLASSPMTFTVGTSSSSSMTLSANGSTINSCTATLPTGLSLSPSCNSISGTPTTVSSTETYNISINYTATPSPAASETETVQITVNAGAPSFGYPSPITAIVNSPVSVTPSPFITNGSAVYNCATTGTSLPAGLSIDPNGCAIIGTPVSSAATATYTVQATNAIASATASPGLTLTVNTAAPTLSYQTGTVIGTLGNAFSVSPTVLLQHGGTSGSLTCASPSPFPAGLSVSASNCQITGTPTTTQAATTYSISATDSIGTSTAATVTIEINPGSDYLSTVATGIPSNSVLTTSGSGNIYYATGASAQVEMIAVATGSPFGVSVTAGTPTVIAATGTAGYIANTSPTPALNIEFASSPPGIALDPTYGNLYLADSGNYLLRMITNSISSPFQTGMTVGYVYNISGNNTTTTLSGLNGPASSASLPLISSLATDSNGNIYLADSTDSKILMIAGQSNTNFGLTATLGNIYTIGGLGGSGVSIYGSLATENYLGSPKGLAADSKNVYFIDENSVAAISKSTGNLTLIAGQQGATGSYSGDGSIATSARFNSPSGLAIVNGGIVITDTGNNRIRMICTTSGTYFGLSMVAGNIYSIAGTGSAGSSGDGGLATGALLNSPQSIAADNIGNLYFIDNGNNKIRKIQY